MSGHRGPVLASAVKFVGRGYAPPLPPPPAIEISHITWQPILKDDRGTVLGAVDLAATVKVRISCLEIFCLELGYKLRDLEKRLIEQIPSDRKFLFWNGKNVWIDGKHADNSMREPLPADGIGIVATKEGAIMIKKVIYDQRPDFKEFRLYVEAKTKIRSVGELMRQMNLYRSIVRPGSRFLISAPSSEWDTKRKRSFVNRDWLRWITWPTEPNDHRRSLLPAISLRCFHEEWPTGIFLLRPLVSQGWDADLRPSYQTIQTALVVPRGPYPTTPSPSSPSSEIRAET